MQIDVEGARELRRNLRKAGGPALNQGMKLIHQEIAGPVAALAKRKAPRRSGRLVSKIRPSSTTTMARIQAGPLIYAPIIEFGGYPGDYKGQSYLYAAMEERAAESLRLYEQKVGEWLDQIWASNI